MKRYEDFPGEEKELRRLAEACRKYKYTPDPAQKRAVYVNLSMVRLQLAWIMPKFLYALGRAKKTGEPVFVIVWRENALLRELVESFGFSLLVLEELPCHRDVRCVAGIVISLRIDEDAVIDAFAEHQHTRDGMELVRLQIRQMLFYEIVICQRIELEVIELCI